MNSKVFLLLLIITLLMSSCSILLPELYPTSTATLEPSSTATSTPSPTQLPKLTDTSTPSPQNLSYALNISFLEAKAMFEKWTDSRFFYSFDLPPMRIFEAHHWELGMVISLMEKDQQCVGVMMTVPADSNFEEYEQYLFVGKVLSHFTTPDGYEWTASNWPKSPGDITIDTFHTHYGYVVVTLSMEESDFISFMIIDSRIFEELPADSVIT